MLICDYFDFCQFSTLKIQIIGTLITLNFAIFNKNNEL